MPDDDTGTTTEATEPLEGGSGTYTPPATQDALDAIISDRLTRDRRKYGDVEALRAKAARLDEIEEANRTDLERITARAEAAEAAVSEAARVSTLRDIADEFSIGVDDLDFIDGPDADTIRAKAERFAARTKVDEAGETGTPRVGFTLGGTQPPSGDAAPSDEDSARNFFGI